MTTVAKQRFDPYEDDCRSEVSTLLGSRVKSIYADSQRSLGKKTSYVNSATCIQSGGTESDSDDDVGDDLGTDDEDVERNSTEDYEDTRKPKQPSKIRELDLSPEAEGRRKEVYDKWIKSVKDREKELNRITRERREAELKALEKTAEARERESEIKVTKWMKRKQLEAVEKITRDAQLKKKVDEEKNKPKEFKRAIDFAAWRAKKDEQVAAVRKQREEDQKKVKTNKTCRESTSSHAYEKWRSKAGDKPKPVPIGKGLDSLRGSSVKIYVNPQPWNNNLD